MPVRIAYRVALILLIATVLLSLSGCKKADFKQAEIPPEDIPEAMWEAAQQSLPYQPAVWRACYEQAGFSIAVASCMHSGAGGLFQQWQWFVFRNGQQIYVNFNIQTSSEPGKYAWNPLEKLITGVTLEENAYVIAAFGWAWDRAAFRVVGTTTQDRSFEGQVVDGFWMLLDPDGEGIDRFETVVLEDGKGKVLHAYDRTELTR